MSFWKQDLTKSEAGIALRTGGIFREGRAKWTLRDDYNGQREKALGLEWHLFTRGSSGGANFHVEPSGDHDFTLHVGVPWVAQLWLHVNGYLHSLHERLRPTGQPRKKDWYEDREIGFSVHDGTIHWRVWMDPDSWSSSDGWRNSSFSYVDFILGKTEHHSEILREVETVIPMPEGPYPAKVVFTRDTWKRPRGRTSVVLRADVTPDKPVPVPGKGENSWDCGDDFISCQIGPGATVAEAVSNFVASVLTKRERYGGSNWQPKEPAK